MVDKADKKVLGECFAKSQFTAGSAVTERTSVQRGLLVAHPGIATHMDANYTKIRWIQGHAGRHLSKGQTCHMRDTRGFSLA